MANNDRTLLLEVLSELEAHGIRAWIFGGWAEELHGLIKPRPHRDIDLLYPAPNFQAVDEYLQDASAPEITAKRFPHKRAFEWKGVMVELFLVHPENLATNFWSRHYHWPSNTLSQTSPLRIASSDALRQYRRDWDSLRQNR